MSPDDFRKAALHLKGAEERVKWGTGIFGSRERVSPPLAIRLSGRGHGHGETDA